MNRFHSILIASALAGISAAVRAAPAPAIPPQLRLHALGAGEVRWTEGFWAGRFAQARSVTIPHMWEYFQGNASNIGMSGIGGSYAWDNFRTAAGEMKGEFSGARWLDGDFYKLLEAVAHVYAVTHDEELDQLMDRVIAVLAKAQQPDGYLNTQITLLRKPLFKTVNDHETYNLGHLMIAAVAHHRATGKTTLLDLGRKAGDRLVAEFLDRPGHFIGYTSIMGLTGLYRVTHEPRYLRLAERFLAMQGEQPGGMTQLQDRVPFRQQEEAVGHAVFGTYLYTGAAGIYAETGEPRLREVLERLWQDIDSRKIFITGGVGGTHHHVDENGEKITEGFGPSYDLSNAHCSNENCGSIGLLLLDWRMLALTGDARYADSAERILYNTLLAGVGLEGKTYFYTNPLRRFGADGVFSEDDTMTRWMHRAGWCCPSNILRIVTQLQEQACYASPDGLWIALYGGSEINTTLADGTRLRLRQRTDYPWDGLVRLDLGLAAEREVTLRLRIPAWTKGATVRVNGQPVTASVTPGTFLALRRLWRDGDRVELNLPMAPVLVEANPAVEQLGAQVAIQRGPVVYCLESPDLPDGVKLMNVALPENISWQTERKSTVAGDMLKLTGSAIAAAPQDWTNRLYQPVATEAGRPVNLRLIPYYAWANRGVSDMSVWLPLVRP